MVLRLAVLARGVGTPLPDAPTGGHVGLQRPVGRAWVSHERGIKRMSIHVLDNPAWHSLNGAHATLGQRSGGAGAYKRQVSVFGAVAEPGALPELADLLEPGGIVGLALPEPIAEPDPRRWKEHRIVPVHQMICDRLVARPVAEMVRLGEENVEEMMALVKLTEPGPFAPRTIEMGNYWGVFEGGKLLAMAGERLRPKGWVELSGVCTHPDGRGRGLAAALCTRVLEGIFSKGAGSFLHVVVGGPSEHTAVGVYERLGFRHRRRMVVQILERL